MIVSLQSYVRQGRHTLRKWLLDPRVHGFLRLGVHFLAGFFLSAASLVHTPQPFAMGLVCACSGWPGLLTALGSCAGYWLFWGSAARLCFIWCIAAYGASLILGNIHIAQQTPLLLPAAASAIVAVTGLLGQTLWQIPGPPVFLYVLQVLLAGGSGALFSAVIRGRNPLYRWISWGVFVLALAQVMPIPYLGLGYIAAGILSTAGAFPAAALAGLALDLAQITPVPMTAVMTAGYLVRFLPLKESLLRYVLPGFLYIFVMRLCGCWDLMPLPGLMIGAIAGKYLPLTSAVPHRRGETGVLQVRLEMVSGVFSQSEQLLSQVPDIPVDEAALIAKAAERACSSCPCSKSCKDSKRIAQLPPLILQKPLLSPQELPIVCRKSGRFLAELHRSQEQLRSIRADRERQKEYRAAVIQQYRFIGEYLQELSDGLGRRKEPAPCIYEPEVFIYGNRPLGENGDWCQQFTGTEDTYYVLLCDGMGTGAGAVRDGRTAGSILRRLLSAGYPAEYALRSLNSLCALRERAGAVTVDLAQLQLNSGKVTLYKWGAAPSYLISRLGTRKVGSAGAPPGLSVTDIQETREQVTLRRGEELVLVSDGIDEADAFSCCSQDTPLTPAELATQLISCSQLSGQDDATVVVIRLKPSR